MAVNLQFQSENLYFLPRASELWSNRQSTDRQSADDNLTPIIMKHGNKNESYLQKRQIEEAQSQRQRELCHLKVAKKKALGRGRVDGESKLTLVEYNTGHIVPSFGVVWSDGKRRLYPEEAIFLQDACQLELYHPDSTIPLSVQEAIEYFTTPNGPLKMEIYFTFIHLCRLGFLVFRHKPAQKTMEVDENFPIKRPSDESHSSPLKLPKLRHGEPSDQMEVIAPEVGKLDISDGDWAFDFSEIELPDEGEAGAKSVRDFGIQYHSHSSHRIRKTNCTCVNWRQYKVYYCSHCKTNQQKRKAESQDKSLFQMGSLKLSEQVTLEDLLASRKSDPGSSVEAETQSMEYQSQLYEYDVYKPRKNFKRSNPGPPDFTVLCGRIDDSFPSLRDLVNSQQHLQKKDNSKLTYSVCDSGDVNFYTLKFDNIPLDLT